MMTMDSILMQQIVTSMRIMLCLLSAPYFIIESFFTVLLRKEKNLKGNIVMVTGAGNGIGRELTLQLADMGCTILCVDIKEEDLIETVRLAKKRKGQKDCAKGYICDISDRKAVEKLRQDVIGEFGRIDILFNNAGLIYATNINESDPCNVERVVKVNILGTVWMTQAFLQEMKKQRSGHIVFVSSIAGLVYVKKMAIYDMTKAALSGLVLSIKDELDNVPEYKDIVLSLVYPSFIQSNELLRLSCTSNWPAVNVSDAVKQMIKGTRLECLEFTVGLPAGYELGVLLLRFMNFLPHKVAVAIKRVFNIQLKPVAEEFYSRSMTTISQRILETELRNNFQNGKTANKSYS